MSSKSYLNKQCGKTFLDLTTNSAHILLDGLLLEHKIKSSLQKLGTLEESFDDRYELYKLYEEEKEVEEVKMLSYNIKEPLLDLDKCSLNEIINILQSFTNYPFFNVHQTGFGSYIANHVIKEKIQRYNNEAMIPPKLGDVWIPKILIDIGKEPHHAILDLGSSVNILPKKLYDLLDLDKKMEKCDINLLLADDSTTHPLGRIDNVTIEHHLNFVPFYFNIMDMRSNISSPIIFVRPFLRTTGAIIDSKEGNVKFQFPHKKCMENFTSKKVNIQVPS
jgi:hypothetical protein